MKAICGPPAMAIQLYLCDRVSAVQVVRDDPQDGYPSPPGLLSAVPPDCDDVCLASLATANTASRRRCLALSCSRSMFPVCPPWVASLPHWQIRPVLLNWATLKAMVQRGTYRFTFPRIVRA